MLDPYMVLGVGKYDDDQTLDDWIFNVVKEYFAKQKRRVWSARRYYRRPLMQRDYAEQYGIIARNLIIEYTTVPE